MEREREAPDSCNLMKTQPILPLVAALLPFAALPLATAGVLPPYTADADTVYLYHFDEAAPATSAANAGSAGFAAIAFDGDPTMNHATNPQPVVPNVLGATGHPGFGKSANLSAVDIGLGVDANSSGGFQLGLNSGPSPDAILHSSLAGADGSFTMEAMVNLPAITGSGVTREIFCTDNPLGNTLRGFQFRINPTGQLEFNFIGTNTSTSLVNIPTTGPHGFVPNQWFHVALAYDGPTHTSHFYWTRVAASSTEANLLGSSTNETTSGSILGALVIGNDARGTANEGLRGYIDEVRISKVVRNADEFLFFNTDTDGDGLDDAWEILYFGSITAQDGTGDPDGDGFDNAAEFAAGTNPTLAASNPDDTDADGLLDAWEITHFGNLTSQDGSDDSDGDFATNLQEQLAGTNPTDTTSFPDIDTDGMSDGWEMFYNLNVGVNDAQLDPDGDGFSNLEEWIARSDPRDAKWTPQKSKLAHRWSFNGNLTDSVGGSDAVIIDPDSNEAVGGGAILSSTDILLEGGQQATSKYVSLGSNLLQGKKTPVTIEFWATHESVRNWSRIFSFGSSTNEYLMMAWTQALSLQTDRVAWRDVSDTIYDNALRPHQLGVQEHIVMTIEPGFGVDGKTLVRLYSGQAGTQLLSRGEFSTANSLALLNDTIMWLGRSQFATDQTANARYNEFRIWNGALTFDELDGYHLAGPNVIDLKDSDGDGMADAWEMLYFGNLTHNGSSDSDGDFYSDLDEYFAGTNPTDQLSSPDSDSDGLADGWEVHFFRTAPTEDLFDIIGKYSGGDDPDGDGLTNAQEFAAKSDPTNPLSTPLDTDADGLVDSWERFHFGNLAQTATGDPDSDGSTNLQEQNAGSDPMLAASTPADMDGNGIPDTEEPFQPYVADSKTLHLWHLDEAMTPVMDAGSDPLTLNSLENGALLWTPSRPGFGTAFNAATGFGTPAAGVLAAHKLVDGVEDDTTMTYAGPDGAFTFEAIVKVGFDPAAPSAPNAEMQIVSGDNDPAGTRVWQFRLVPRNGVPELEFININGSVDVQTIAMPVPVGAAPDAIVKGGWFHVAVTYNGTEDTADNLKMYWTALDPSRTQANEIGSASMKRDLIVSTPDFTIGNEGRAISGASAAFEGLVDEVRISSVARSATGFYFTGGGSDSDADGMDDAWEIIYFGNLNETASGDFDHDGTSNLTEFRLGLVPNDGSSRFAATHAGSGQLTWPSAVGVTFTVERSTALATGGWTAIGTVEGTAGTATFTDPNPPAGKAFYRIVLMP